MEKLLSFFASAFSVTLIVSTGVIMGLVFAMATRKHMFGGVMGAVLIGMLGGVLGGVLFSSVVKTVIVWLMVNPADVNFVAVTLGSLLLLWVFAQASKTQF